jgi:competence protein ComEA
MWETIRGYLTFTRKERFGVLFLLVIISLLFVLPYFFRPEPGEPDPEKYEKMKIGIQKFESVHPDSFRKTDDQNREAGRKQEFKSPAKRVPKENRQLFYFDPNTLKPEGWQRLGLTDHLAQTIVHFIEKAGQFRKPEDLKKIYGLQAAEYERLLPYVRIFKEPQPVRNPSGDPAKGIKNGTPAEAMIPHVSKKLEITDINEADSSQWCRLPGIGAKLASRIVHFRDLLGGFYLVDQVGETFGLPDSTFQKIKPVLVLNAVSVVLIDLNNASKESLQLHPYIRWQVAKAIITYRNQHGNFRSVEELMQLALMDSVKFVKLKPYLTVYP